MDSTESRDPNAKLTDAFHEYVEENLVEQGMSPSRLAELVTDQLDVTEEQVLRFISEKYTLTDSPGRRSFNYCLRCNPYLNGSHGKDGTEAVAKHYIQNEEGTEQALTGWEGLCYDCASTMVHNPYATLEPLDGHEDLDIFDTETETTHECTDPNWNKLSLVTESGGFDWVECNECGIQAKRHSINRIEVVGYDKR